MLLLFHKKGKHMSWLCFCLDSRWSRSQGLQFRPILPNFGEMLRIRPPLISKKSAMFIKNRHCLSKKSVLSIKNLIQKSDSTTSNFCHSIKFLNTDHSTPVSAIYVPERPLVAKLWHLGGLASLTHKKKSLAGHSQP
jgi:hypothetical protein